MSETTRVALVRVASSRVLDFLASVGAPAITIVTGAVADDIMLQTSGTILSRGVLYDIMIKQISPHEYRLSLRRTN